MSESIIDVLEDAAFQSQDYVIQDPTLHMSKEEWEQAANDIQGYVVNQCPAQDIHEAMGFSFSHTVWEDGNYKPSDIQSCIDSGLKGEHSDGYSPVALKWVMWSLYTLALLPDYKEEW